MLVHEVGASVFSYERSAVINGIVMNIKAGYAKEKLKLDTIVNLEVSNICLIEQ